jgi:malonyl-CoA O-methyltransferase
MDKTIEWLYSAECKSGGLAAWRGYGGVWFDPYPEVTGYLLPTLIRNGAEDLALRCSDWLLTVQNEDGSYNGLDKIPRPFDTGAIVEGLLFTFGHTQDVKYLKAADKAIDWMRSQISDEGYLHNSPTNKSAEIYNLRASAIISNKTELAYWKERGLIQGGQRTHYIAYALEGVLNFGDTQFAIQHLEQAYKKQKGLMPFYVDAEWNDMRTGYDICSTIQMAILFNRLGWDISDYYFTINEYIHPNGGVPQSPEDRREIAWAAKFWLDFKKAVE